ncbi:hypothetical protein PIB30_101232 [Stylosanthes scabra]|uniref:Uncharacterized protein n=1 Tax=Stylosanthes scabra TaxID=79078 RepID=A0ABU6RYA7_9FABA|nr:hypothetical protein [Stylosanthes scabra]
MSYDEALCAFQRENQEMREAQKRTESQLNHLTEMLQKLISQQSSAIATSTKPQGGHKCYPKQRGREEEDEDENEEGSVSWWYDLLAYLVDSDDEEGKENEDEFDEEDKDKSTKEDSEDESDEEKMRQKKKERVKRTKRKSITTKEHSS